MKGVLPWLIRCALHAGTRDFYPALAVLVGPVHNIFVLTVRYLIYVSPFAQQPWQAVVRGRLSPYGTRHLYWIPIAALHLQCVSPSE
jgi:hypothetical protein